MFLSGAAAELASGTVGSESSSLFGYSFVVISLVGMVGSFLLWYLRIIFGSLLFRFMFYQLNLSDTCVEYGWFSLWFSHHPYTKSGSSHIKPFQKSSKQRVVIRTNEPKEEDSIATTNISEMISNLKVNFVPGYGIHVVYRKGEPLIISISVNTNNNNMYSQEEKTREDIVIWKPRHFITEALVRLLFPCQNGVNNSNSVIEMLENAGVAKEFLSYNPTYPKSIDNAYSVFRELLCDCFYVHTLMTREKTSVYTPYYQQWTLASFKEKRAQHTVILDEGVWEDLHNDVTKFLKSKQWYKDRGIPYRRGYLLYGEPGCGKTTTISSIAACLNMNICVFSLDSQTTDASMQMLFSTVPPNSILVFEDIDSIFPKEDDEKKSDSATDDISQGKSLVKTNSKTTFSAILNCLDGISSQESRIVFMTTNFKEKLPPALIRNGRVDRKIYLGLATKHQFYKMTQNFYPDEYTTEKVDEMWENVKQFSFGMANLQGFFLRNETLDAAVKSSHDFEKYMKEETQNQ